MSTCLHGYADDRPCDRCAPPVTAPDTRWTIEWLVDPDTLVDPRLADQIRHLRALGGES